MITNILVIQLHSYTITQLYCYTVTVTQLYSYTVTQLYCYTVTVTQLYSYTVTQLHSYTVIQLYSYTITQSYSYTSYTVIQLHNYTVTQLYSYTQLLTNMTTTVSLPHAMRGREIIITIMLMYKHTGGVLVDSSLFNLSEKPFNNEFPPTLTILLCNAWKR